MERFDAADATWSSEDLHIWGTVIDGRVLHLDGEHAISEIAVCPVCREFGFEES